MKKTVRIKSDALTIAINIVGYTVISIYTLFCIFPLLIMISSSFSSEKSIITDGYTIWPREFSVFAYKILFVTPEYLLGSYAVTIGLTVVGTAVGLFIVAMTGYALQRQDFPYRNTISFYIYFTTLFSGGLVPFYILMTRYLHLKDNYLSVLLVGLMSPWLIILMKNFLKSIPHSITESAKIDGCNDFMVFIKIIFPMAKPALATVGLFLAMSYWNEWYNSMLFLSANVKYRPLQLYLYTVINVAFYLKNTTAGANATVSDSPTETMKLAVALLATVPILLFYPFVQRYFIKGITIGAVKG